MIPTNENTPERANATMEMLNKIGLTEKQQSFVGICATQLVDIIEEQILYGARMGFVKKGEVLMFCRVILATAMKASGVE